MVTDDLVAYSREVIRTGSRSFAAAASLFDAETRASAYLLYAWCRHCDDQADGQELGRDVVDLSPAEQRARVETLVAQTRAALAGDAMAEPVFRAFQAVARRHALPPGYALDHLRGFQLDADGGPVRTFEDLLAYCYHVAGVVGVMMAWIMGARDEPTLDRACDLGVAFQLTNIARDVVEDAAAGRLYLPETWLREAGVPRDAVAAPAHRAAVHALAVRLVREAEPYYDSARWGMARLPFRSAWAVGAARGVYREIGRKLTREGPDAWDGRLSTTRTEKLGQVLRGLGAAAWAMTVDKVRRPTSRDSLWTRPGRAGAESGVDDRRRSGLQPIQGEQPV